MPRPTPARLLYLVVGLVLGLIATVAGQIYLLPGVASSVPFLVSATPTPAVPTGPTQFGATTLDRVVPLNLAQEKNGVTIRLNALELYHDGFSFTYAVMSGRGGVAPQTLEPETFAVTDDKNTAYTLAPIASGDVPSAGFTTGQAAFTPAPPADAKTLRVTVPNAIAVGLRLREGQSRVAAGPWEFSIALKT